MLNVNVKTAKPDFSNKKLNVTLSSTVGIDGPRQAEFLPTSPPLPPNPQQNKTKPPINYM